LKFIDANPTSRRDFEFALDIQWLDAVLGVENNLVVYRDPACNGMDRESR
jgi:hypothetical protein